MGIRGHTPQDREQPGKSCVPDLFKWLATGLTVMGHDAGHYRTSIAMGD